MGLLQAIRNAWYGFDEADSGASNDELRSRLQVLKTKHKELLEAPCALTKNGTLSDRIQALQLKHGLQSSTAVTGGAIQANAFGGVGEAGYGFFHGASEPSQWPKSHDNQWHEDQSQSEREEDLFTLLSFHDDIMSNVNPATGLPMIGGVDTAGNPFGFDLHENSMASISFDE